MCCAPHCLGCLIEAWTVQPHPTASGLVFHLSGYRDPADRDPQGSAVLFNTPLPLEVIGGLAYLGLSHFKSRPRHTLVVLVLCTL